MGSAWRIGRSVLSPAGFRVWDLGFPSSFSGSGIVVVGVCAFSWFNDSFFCLSKASSARGFFVRYPSREMVLLPTLSTLSALPSCFLFLDILAVGELSWSGV